MSHCVENSIYRSQCFNRNQNSQWIPGNQNEIPERTWVNNKITLLLKSNQCIPSWNKKTNEKRGGGEGRGRLTYITYI